MAELKRCPECGGVATVIHMYDTYDRADFGWSAGCGRYRAGDGLHTKEMKVSGLPSKEKAIEAWNRMVDKETRKLILAGETHLDNLAEGFREADRVIREMPTVDAEVVVRCKDCEYSYDEISYLCCSHGVCDDCEVPPNFYCAYGKRRSENEPPEEGET